MAWQDYGTIFEVKDLMPWARSHAYVPTALCLHDRIRVFVAFWDQESRGRLGYVDVDLDNPCKILGYSQTPLVEDSTSGRFDCDGITPLSIVQLEDQTLLYYAGWQRDPDPNIRYKLYTGLLIGDAHAQHFQRYSSKPVIGARSPTEHVRTGGQIVKTEEGYHCWLATQKGSHSETGKSLPIYDLEYTRSDDGIHWSNDQQAVFEHQKNIILGFGRSAIWQTENGTFEGLFSVRNWNGIYTDMLSSRSSDGVTWEPLSHKGKAFHASDTIDDQTSICFPSVVKQGKRLLMFYNGDNFGKKGLRLASWNL